MTTAVISKKDKFTAHAINSRMAAAGRGYAFALAYHLQSENISVKSQLLIQIFNNQSRMF